MVETIIYSGYQMSKYKIGNGDVVEINNGASKAKRRIAGIRAERNALLSDTDSMIVSDRGLSDSKVTKWKTYRQELRDMDFSASDITWPTKPSY